MSGISPTSGSSSNLSSVGQSLLTSGQAPNAAAASSSSSAQTSSASGQLNAYQSEYLQLQQYDDQELLYASFLDQSDALANADAVFAQAAQLLGAPGQQSAAQTAANANVAPAASATSSSTSSASSSLDNLPSVSSILAQSDQEAQAALNAYANAPAGSSILDYQA